MEDRKLNELNDETLDSVTGGAFAAKNWNTGKYDVFSAKKQYIASYDTEDEAKREAQRYTAENEAYIQTTPMAPWLPPSFTSGH